MKSMMGVRKYNKEQELNRAVSIKVNTRNAQSAARERQCELFCQQRDQGLDIVEDKFKFEKSIQQEHEKTLVKMVEVEQELLMRLKNTQARVAVAH